MKFSSQNVGFIMTEIFQRKSLALIETASFFDEERGEKDTVESRFPAPKKTKNPLKIN